MKYNVLKMLQLVSSKTRLISLKNSLLNHCLTQCSSWPEEILLEHSLSGFSTTSLNSLRSRLLQRTTLLELVELNQSPLDTSRNKPSLFKISQLLQVLVCGLSSPSISLESNLPRSSKTSSTLKIIRWLPHT